jgi:hypothetical protein
MARRTLPDSGHVPIALTVSGTDAAQIDEVLTRPEFAGWSRPEWCREIIRTALRYYMRAPSADAGEARGSARPAAARPGPASEQPAQASEQPAPPSPSRPPAPVASSAQAPAPASQRRPPPTEQPAPADQAPGEALPGGWDGPEQPAQPQCPHPADARDYERGVCAACGAVIWD